MQFIHDVKIEKKYNVYGYNRDMDNFLKIEVYEPWLIKITAKILQEGGVFGVSM